MKSAKKATVRRILHYVRPYRLWILFIILCSAITATVQLLIPIFSGNAIDAMLGPQKVQFSVVLEQVVYIAAAAILAAIAQHFLSVLNNRVTYSICRDLRNSVNRKIHVLPLSYLDRHPTGDLVSRMITDVDTFADGILMGLTQVFTGVITIFGTLGIMLYLNWLIALVVVALTPLSLFVAGFIAKNTHRYFQQQAVLRGEQTALINELIDGQRVVHAYGHEQVSIEEFDSINTKLEKAARNATFFSSLTNPSTRLVNNIVYGVVTLISGLYTISGGISIGQLSVFLSYASQYAKPFNEISSVITELQNAMACADRIFSFLDEQEQPPEKNAVLPEKIAGAVQMNQVCFQYEPQRPLIQNFSLNVQPGQHIAIVGPTGCGKTTLINLLMRFYDVQDGSITIDHADIRDLTRHSVRSCYGMVLQDTWLKAGTVRENITYAKPDATEAEIVGAAKAAHAHSFICRLPKGYETQLTENGENLSVGQRQLLCIARAMIQLPPMLILDEATSSIDTRTELQIQAAFHTMMQGRTSFVVAHRLSTIRRADVILVMNQGRIVEQGDHETLLRKNGFYAKLYNSQFGMTESVGTGR